MDIQNGVSGYNTDPARVADTFCHFNPSRCIAKSLNVGTHIIKLDFKPKNKIFCVSTYGVQSAYYDVQTGKISNGSTSGASIAFSITASNDNTVTLQVKNNTSLWILYY